jgi:hypothetical protein
MSDIDILSIDARIHQNFYEEVEKLPEYCNKLKDLLISLKLDNLRPRLLNTLNENKNNLLQRIQQLENNSQLNFYITESALLLDKYQKILKEPIKVNFMGKPVKNNKEKEKIIIAYLNIAKKYIEMDIEIPEKKNKIECGNCPNRKEFEILEGNIYICRICSAQQLILKHISSYKDIDRVNISSKYMYDRKIHFRDCINQYQGKQNSTISTKVYKDLENQFEKHHLLNDQHDTKKEKRFNLITKEHIGMFLKDLDYTKHYENINLIHYNFTGIKPDDIRYLEDQLLEDFDLLTELYDKKYRHNVDRTNFINTQYVLYQLLTRHKHPCVKEDFTVLKTIDRKTFHDEICSDLFSQLGWNHQSFF